MSVLLQVLVAVSQVSVVQALPSLQSAFEVQQPTTAVFEHVPELQVSVVQALLSLQPALLLQQPAIAECEHVWLAGSHTSAVQLLPSEQSPFVRQQPATTVLLQVPVAVLQRIWVVQAFWSLQSASLAQHPVFAV